LVAAYQSAPIWTTYYKNYIKPLSELEE
jgi:hypothetical protein